VASHKSDEVLRHHGWIGEFLGTAVARGTQGLAGHTYLTFTEQ
jgi:hypothetical protein